MRRQMIAVGVLLLGLGACTVPNAGSPTSAGSLEAAAPPPDDTYPPDFRHVMFNVGVDYYSAVSHHDPNWTDRVVQQCYDQQTPNPANFYREGLTRSYRDGVRRCMILDYLGYKDNQNATHNERLAGDPYFSLTAADQRWRFWFSRAGFSTPEAMFQYLRTGYGYAKPVEINTARQLGQPLNVIPPRGAKLPSIFGGS